MEIRPLKTDEKIAEAIRQNCGGDYSAYRKAQVRDVETSSRIIPLVNDLTHILLEDGKNILH